MRTIVTKSEFARLKQRDLSTISHWIRDGKISKASLVGDGVRAKIWLEQANRDLELGLDLGQQTAQEQPAIGSPGSALPVVPDAPAASQPAEDGDLKRIRRANAISAEEAATAAQRRNAIEDGRWIDAAAAAREWARELATIRQDYETFLFQKVCREIGEHFGIDWKEVAVVCRGLYREFSTGQADAADAELAELERAAAAPAEEVSPPGEPAAETPIAASAALEVAVHPGPEPPTEARSS